ncbi:MAG TPA: hypothetical protein VLZ30_04885 [Verrucomicrobiae bacterium]|nr:hypothetical protein [Verrucomicrobiae bacterium]
MTDSMYLLCLLVWVVVGLAIALRSRDPARYGVGLTLTFILNMAMNHWFGALVCMLPWYLPSGADFVTTGFELSTLGIVGFAVGCFAVAPFVSPDHHDRAEESVSIWPWRPRVLRIYTLVGIGSYVAMAVGASRVPSLTAVLSAGFNFVLVALCLAMWYAQLRGEHTRQHLLLAAAFALPFFTMVTQGFLGYGVGYLILVFSFYLLLSRHRVKLLLVSLPLAFFALSFYVTYMRDRNEIRETVWGGQAYESRVDAIWHMCTTMELFDPLDPKHLGRIDVRLNQNRLVGTAALRLQNMRGYAHGETLWMALIAIIPRAIWADKPEYAGSMDLVSKYTGITFQQGTSVGMGPIFELEINFGSIGVFLGMLLLGVLLGVADRRAGAALRLDDPLTFGKWFLIGIITQNALGSFAETTASLAAALILVSIVNHYLRSHPGPDLPGSMDAYPVKS